MIVPSSNTVAEPELARLAGAGAMALAVTRVRVTEISLTADAIAQFDPAPMAAAAALLGDARVDAIAWAGTAGSWLGLDHDRRLVAAMSAAADAPATTSTLALLDACHSAGISRIGLITPYTDAVVRRIAAVFAGEGISVTAERHLGLTHNHAFAAVGAGTIARMADDCSGSGAQAIVVLCTNLPGGLAAAQIQARTGLPVLDSVAVTLDATLTVAQSIGGTCGS